MLTSAEIVIAREAALVDELEQRVEQALALIGRDLRARQRLGPAGESPALVPSAPDCPPRHHLIRLSG